MTKGIKSKREKKQGICAYCGRIDKLSEDHVIPQCLFVKPLPDNLPKVYACERCNNVVKSANDVYLRDMLFMDRQNEHHPVVQQLIDKFHRAVEGHHSSAAKYALENSQLVQMRSPSGFFLDWTYAVQIPRQKLSDILSLIVRGLYQFYTGNRLSQEARITIRAIQGNSQELFQTNVQILLHEKAPVMWVGDGTVFIGIYGLWKPGLEASLWYLVFYQSAVFEAVINEQEMREARSARVNNKRL